MIKTLTLRVKPQEAANDELIKRIVAKEIRTPENQITTIRILRRSIDARQRMVMIQLQIDVYIGEEAPEIKLSQFSYNSVRNAEAVIVVGAGPAGLFAALRLIELGLRPIVLERGKEVGERKKDNAQINRHQPVNPESNYAFGEGGAGAFSDGKLYTRSKKRGDVMRILELFCHHGADKEILVDTHPHIGTDKLPTIIKNMRNTILESGGEVHFSTKVSGLIIKENQIEGVTLASGEKINAKAVILATGHSAKDVYYWLDEQNVKLEAKSWAMGVRVEHPQLLIDQIQYHSKEGRGEYLPAASYSLNAQVNGRGVYSFCMCPGGFIVPAMTSPDEMVVNGMSPSQRNSQWANSGMVVEIHPEDLTEYQQFGALAGLKYQHDLERLCFTKSGEGNRAPAQRLDDFVTGRVSKDLPSCSYVPGIVSSDLHNWLPKIISKTLQGGFREFDKKTPGYLSHDAVVVGVESRTSSPVRVPRAFDTLQHIEIAGLYPCGEGAGYAGGITSSAMDGERCAESCLNWINSKK